MDGSHFDRLTRSLTLAGSRRRAFGGLVLGALGLAGWQAQEEAAAHDLSVRCKKKSGKAKKKCLKKAKQHNATHIILPPPLICGTGQKPCGGNCIPSNQCCLDADCPALRPHCQQGACTCPPERPLVCSGSPVCQQCCTVTDCRPDTWSDRQACQNGQCVCTKVGTERCPSGTTFAGICGKCCGDSECSGGDRGSTCFSLAHGDPSCGCESLNSCQGVCIPDDCRFMCGDVCSSIGIGNSCCGDGALTCQLTLGEPVCLPPP